MTPRRALLLIPIVAVGVAAAGCGGSDTAQTTTSAARQAAAVIGDTRTCPANSPSFTYKATIRNRLDSPIMLRASEYDCNDWDGTSTPGHAFSGQVLQPGEKRTFTLQPAKYTTRNWSMDFVGPTGNPFYGRARLQIQQTSVESDSIKAVGSKEDGGWTVNRHGVQSCYLLPMETTGAPDTGMSDIEFFTHVPLTVMVRNGRITLATVCSGMAGA